MLVCWHSQACLTTLQLLQQHGKPLAALFAALFAAVSATLTWMAARATKIVITAPNLEFMQSLQAERRAATVRPAWGCAGALFCG